MNNAAACAFPTGAEGDPGLTKREYFAAMAMQGMCANSGGIALDADFEQLAKESVEAADALLVALEATPAQQSGAK